MIILGLLVQKIFPIVGKEPGGINRFFSVVQEFVVVQSRFPHGS